MPENLLKGSSFNAWRQDQCFWPTLHLPRARWRDAFILLAYLICVPADDSIAMPAVRSIEAWTRDSDSIVLAKLDSVREVSIDGKRAARATVIEVWKGPDMRSFCFDASSSSPCSHFTGSKGQTVLLYLERISNPEPREQNRRSLIFVRRVTPEFRWLRFEAVAIPDSKANGSTVRCLSIAELAVEKSQVLKSLNADSRNNNFRPVVDKPPKTNLDVVESGSSADFKSARSGINRP